MKIPRKYFQKPNVAFEVVDSDGRFLYGGDNILDGICTHHDKGDMETYSFRPKASGVFNFWCDSDEILKVERVEKAGLLETF